jgi:hypothetical protein
MSLAIVPDFDDFDDDFEFDAEPSAPETADLAETYAARLIAAKARLDELTARADARIAEHQGRIERVNANYEAQAAPMKQRIAWLTLSLEGHVRARKEQTGGKIKSVKLLEGVTLKLTAPRGSVVVSDPEAVIAFAAMNHLPQLVNYPEPPPPRPAKTELTKLAKAPDGRAFGESIEHDLIVEGEIVPGVAWVIPAKDTFSIEIEEA